MLGLGGAAFLPLPLPSCRYTDEQKEIAIKKSIHTALNRTFATDKVILENWKAVPEVGWAVHCFHALTQE